VEDGELWKTPYCDVDCTVARTIQVYIHSQVVCLATVGLEAQDRPVSRTLSLPRTGTSSLLVESGAVRYVHNIMCASTSCSNK
jgi:hypothetical protein